MKAESDPSTVFPQDPAPVALAELEVRTLRPDEQARAAQLLNPQHYLGAGQRDGHTLTQVVHQHGRWVALLGWGPTALKLTDREAWIGWSDFQRAERLGLVVQNRRFLVLGATRRPNLASRALGLALPAAYAPGRNGQSPERALPLKVPQIESLADALRQGPDPRAANRVFACPSRLTLVALALLAGRQHLAQRHRFGQCLTQAQRARFG